MQGSGTFAIEAALGSFCPGRGRKTLVLINGSYGERAAQIFEHIKRPYTVIDQGDTRPIQPDEVAQHLDADPDIQVVLAVHCETTSGIVNPLSEIARVVKARGRTLIVDAMSSFGALPIDMAADKIDVMISSSNKCIEGVPGFSYVLCGRELLQSSAGRCHSVVLDLHAQWAALEKTGQFRFTPPTHALVAFAQALRELAAGGGVEARLRRYRANQSTSSRACGASGLSP